MRTVAVSSPARARAELLPAAPAGSGAVLRAADGQTYLLEPRVLRAFGPEVLRELRRMRCAPGAPEFDVLELTPAVARRMLRHARLPDGRLYCAFDSRAVARAAERLAASSAEPNHKSIRHEIDGREGLEPVRRVQTLAYAQAGHPLPEAPEEAAGPQEERAGQPPGHREEPRKQP